MNNRLAWVGVLVVCLLNSGCRRLVDSDFGNYEKTPVLNSIITAGDNINIHLTYVTRVNAVDVEAVDNATVSLFVDGVFSEQLSYSGDGLYESNIIAEEEQSYGFEVLIPDHDIISVECKVPKATEIINVTHIEKAGIDNEGTTYPGLKILFGNNPLQKQYYEVVIKLLVYDDIVRYASLERIVDPILLKEGLPIAIFSNADIKGDTYELTLNYTTGNSGNNGTTLFPLIVELRTVSEDYYKYRKQLYLYEIGRYPDGLGSGNSSFQLYSNVTNAHGISAAYSSVVTDTIYPKGAVQWSPHY